MARDDGARGSSRPRTETRAQGRPTSDTAQTRARFAEGIEGATLTRHLDALEQAGLVVRTRDATDRRAIRVEPTDAGRTLHQELLRAVLAFDKRLRAGFDDAELEQLRALLLRIEENFGRPESGAPEA